MDAKDILGLPKNSFSSCLEKKSRPPKESQRKPDGISREVYALTGGNLPPVMPTIDISHFKPRPQNLENKEKITWKWLPFTSSARKDNLQLCHWVRIVNGVTPTEDYSFAKYNKKVDVLKYTDEEYEKHLTDPTWTKEETNQLFDLCERFDLHFVVIADRFPSNRSVEELKNRYYAVSRARLLARAPTTSDVSGHPLVKETYNMAHEVERKKALSALFSQTKQTEKREAEILAEAKRIMELRVAEKGVEDDELQTNNPDIDGTEKPPAAAETSSPIPATTETPSIPASLRMLRVYLRSYALKQMVQAINTNVGPRAIKRVEQTLQDLGVHLNPKVPTRSVCAEHHELRREILTLLNLQKQIQNLDVEASANRENSYIEGPNSPKIQNLDVEASANRENSYIEGPNSPKRSYRGDLDRTCVPDTVGYGGDRLGKKDHKRKGPGRFNDTSPSPPQSKRPRKLKASD